jgi:ribonuclease-3
MTEIERAIGYRFKNSFWLETALTHSSYANEQKKTQDSNERQEFLGDAVLSMIVSDYIFRHRRVARAS